MLFTNVDYAAEGEFFFFFFFWGGGGGVYSLEFLMEVLQTLTLLQTKICSFPVPFFKLGPNCSKGG